MLKLRGQPKDRQLLAKILVVIGLVTLGGSVFHAANMLKIIQYNASTGVETYWMNVALALIAVVAIGAVPIVVGVLLFWLGLRRASRDGKPERGEK